MTGTHDLHGQGPDTDEDLVLLVGTADKKVMAELAGLSGMNLSESGGIVIPEIEDALKDPKAWNTQWENAMSPESNGGVVFSPRLWYRSQVEEFKIAAKANRYFMDALYGEYPANFRGTLMLQITIIQDIFTFGTTQRFDARWLQADRSVREKHVLFSLSRICSSANNLHDARKYCPDELNLAHLSDSGKPLIALLKTVIPVGDLRTPPSTLSYFPHPDWNALREFHETSNPGEFEKLSYGRMLVLRTKLISHVIHTIFRSFMDLPVHNIQISKVHTVREEIQRERGISRPPPPPSAIVSRSGCNSKVCPKGWDNESSVPKKATLLRCRNCWDKQRREIKYCSKECQKADWKSGHKAVCGNPLNFDLVDEMAASSSTALIRPPTSKYVPIVGPAKPGFERSMSLDHQIARLSVHSHLDYVLIPFTEAQLDPQYHILFPESEMKRLFRVVREKAFTTGDLEAVAIMAHAMCWWISGGHYNGLVTPAIVFNQMQTEFYFEEVKMAVTQMEERRRRDPHYRP
ncbi:MYND-type domain-containing protein [Favolaschia claudopus]|uniref:MYND-type domain-containing protein n=1 Tax=Favolaschia claudopus TaxID=2862362 RepID=A0AAV9ZBP6_9AGAR